MANTTTRKRTATKPAAAAETADVKTEPENTSAKKTETREAPEKFVPKEIDVHQFIPVKNGFHGRLIYQSRRTGELFIWNKFGEEQDIELQELRNAKNTSKDFFINNWFMFDKDYHWVVDYLGMKQYYKYTLSVDGFDEIFKKTPEQIVTLVRGLPDGQKKSLVYRARDMIASGEIDSRKVIAALEDALGIELIEK